MIKTLKELINLLREVKNAKEKESNKQEQTTVEDAKVEEVINENLYTGNSEDTKADDDFIEHQCCICHAPESAVNLIIRGPHNHYICEKCASMINEQITEINKYNQDLEETAEATRRMLEESTSAPKKNQSIKDIVPTPHEIKEFLDEYVIGQDEAKIKLSVAVYNHYKRIHQKEDDTDIEKASILLLGATGSGKTLLAKTIAKLLDVPMTIVDANTFTQAGYVGEDVESILSRLYQAADGDLSRAEVGIVFIDEIDKIAKQGDSPSITKDVSGEGVQQALLKILEGSKVKFAPNGGRKHPDKEMVEIDTKNILFICSGAFVGIEKRIEKRLNMRAIGFDTISSTRNVDKTNMIEYLTAEDVRAFGMIPELVGRLPVITYVKNLTKEELRKVLTEPKNSIIKQYVKLFKMDNVKLEFEDEALDYIVEKAINMKTGARGLRSIVEEIMTQYMYDIPSTKKRKLVITKEYAENTYEAKQNFKEG